MTHGGLQAIDIALMASSLLLPILGLAFLWVTRRTLGGLSLGLTVCLWGLFWLTFGTGMTMVETGYAGGAVTPFAVAQFVFVGMAGSMAAFGIVYPGIVLERRHKMALGVVALVVAGFFAYFLLERSWVVTLEGPSDSYWGPLDLVVSAALLTVVALLGRRWLASPPGDRRTQVAWGVLPFLFWALGEALVWHVYPVFLGPRHGLGWWLAEPVAAVAHLGAVVALVAALSVVGIALARVVRGEPEPDERALGFVTLYLLPVTFLAVLDPVYAVGGIPDVWPLLLNLFVFLVLYGVARYSIVDLDLKLKWGLEKSTVVGAFAVAFLVVSEAVEALLGLEGALFGIGAAVVIGLFFRRLERGAESVVDRLLPGVEDSADYLDGRRATLYKAQAEALLADGELSAKERRALDRLKEELELDGQKAQRIEQRVLQAVGAPG